MQITYIKKKIFFKLAIFLPIIVLLSLILFFVNLNKNSLIKKEASIQSEISSTKSKLDKLLKNQQRLSEDLKIWNAMTPDEKRMSGLRINDAKNIVDKLAKQAFLSDIRTTFSKPEKLGVEFTTDNINVLSSNIKISFKALTDEYVINFIEELTKEFPGFIRLDSISVALEDEIDKNIIREIAYGQNPGIVKATVSFIWKDMKYTKSVSQEREG